jgi:tetratricopeptide (TPR) repeat protein
VVGAVSAVAALLVVPEARRLLNLDPPQTPSKPSKKTPVVAIDRFARAQGFLTSKRYSDALLEIEADLKDNGPSASSLVLKGNILWEKGDRAGSIECHRKAIKLFPEDESAYRNLLSGLEQDAKFDAVIVEVLSIPETMKELKSWAQLRLGNAYLQTHQNSKAAIAFERAIQGGFDSASNRNWCGVACYRAGDIHGAKRWILRAIELDNKVGVYHKNLGQTYLKLDAVDEAVTSFNRYLDLISDPSERRSQLALVQSWIDATDDRLYGE